MAGQIHDLTLQCTDREALRVDEEVIKLRSIGLKLRFEIEDVFENRLYRADMLTDTDHATQLTPEVLRCR